MYRHSSSCAPAISASPGHSRRRLELDLGVQHVLVALSAGRGGSCELMIGCVAQAAAGQQLRVDPDEMEDVRCEGAVFGDVGFKVLLG